MSALDQIALQLASFANKMGIKEIDWEYLFTNPTIRQATNSILSEGLSNLANQYKKKHGHVEGHEKWTDAYKNTTKVGKSCGCGYM